MIHYIYMTSRKYPKVLVVAPDVVGKKMAGPGIRYYEIAKSIAQHMPVIFAVGVEGSDLPKFNSDAISVHSYNSLGELTSLIDQSDVIFCQFIDTNAVTYALSKNKRIIYDYYNVLPIETVGADRISGYTGVDDKNREFTELLKYFSFCSQTGSYFVASNDRQRDYWMGYIMANQAIMPSNATGKDVSDFIGLVPFGMESLPPNQTTHGLRGKYGITDTDFVLLWCGGIWDWFDADTPIRAVANLAKKNPSIKLVFYGTTHPNKNIGTPKNVTKAISLAKDLGVYQKNVIFHEGWVPASERANYLLDADIAISTHLKSLETHFAFRTRILDHFWANLPTIATRGDWFTEYIEKNDLGVGVDSSDVKQIEDAICVLMDEQKRNEVIENIKDIRDYWQWKNTTKPLIDALKNYQSLPIRKHQEQASSDTYINLTGYLKQSKAINKLRSTRVWPILKATRARFRR